MNGSDKRRGSGDNRASSRNREGGGNRPGDRERSGTSGRPDDRKGDTRGSGDERRISGRPGGGRSENPDRRDRQFRPRTPQPPRPADPQEQTDDSLYWGRHAVLSLLEETPEKVLKVYLRKGSDLRLAARVTEFCKAASIPFLFLEADALERLCPGANHQGLVAQAAPAELRDIETLLPLLREKNTPALVVVLDHLKDPHNLGSIIRSAEVAGALAVILPRRRGALPTGTVAKVSSGAALRIPLVGVTNLVAALEFLKEQGLWVLGLHAEGPDSLWKGDACPSRLALVVGEEETGLSRLVAETCDFLRFIPMRGRTGSLNAAVAAAVGMFEWVRTVDDTPR
ncbi:23S rRNA (guanosine(2251)-2'-O)-methyltransferase RlmB [Aminiphilus sp.]|jgi:23S rRNA (guanosine2251-2'-O)-methyltransferase|uniref:23S rRNA (guanosine(2251)-2'-O)-methyltransferase RlmB n=1 Tax=Aminiphilus sp. TaxID=1872488 RepID=UPI00260F7A34|nr:23S rRNA (guanosine(2251)-2'-O)-methyltransferase RlmB [Aminiphilus sp.]